MAIKRGKKSVASTSKPAARKPAQSPVRVKTSPAPAGSAGAAGGAAGTARSAARPPAGAPAARPAASAAARSAPAKPPAAPAGPTLLEQAERFWDLILQTKLTAADPWAYTPKARAWASRTQSLLEEIARSGEGPANQAAYQKLVAEVEADADFREARQRA